MAVSICVSPLLISGAISALQQSIAELNFQKMRAKKIERRGERKGGVIMKVLFRRLKTGLEPNPMRTSLHLKWGLSHGVLNAK